MATKVLNLQAILFDMDGTLVDSTAGVEGAWKIFNLTYPHIDVHDILSSAHGVRTVDNLKNYCKVEDPELLESEAVRFEEAILSSSSEGGRPGIVTLPGTQGIMDVIAESRFFPNPRWAICTSATNPYASAALTRTGIPIPEVFVTAESVERGKPFPDPYLVGAKLAGVKPEECVVFEDSPNGVRSGKAAGCITVALLTTHSRKELELAEADYIIQHLASVSTKLTDSGVELTLTLA